MSEVMETADWHQLLSKYDCAVRLIDAGKRVAENSYLHVDLLDEQPPEVQEIVSLAERAASIGLESYNVVRLGRSKREIALLSYSDFFDAPFPVLQASRLVDVDARRISETSFEQQKNPPILHRKELLLPNDHPRHAEYEEVTKALEDYGAFDRPAHLIGRQQQWQTILQDLGLRIEDGKVRASLADATLNIIRHRTAIARSRLSSPMQALAKWGFFEGTSVFDYGCGRGDDVRALRQAGIDAAGWDPHFAPDDPTVEADVVNLGFVLNVIEDPSERKLALQNAFSIAKRVLAVAVMLEGKGTGERLGDGVVTSRGTFQKYFAQGEIAEYLRRVLGREPAAVGPGLFLVFRTDEEEQSFLAKRQRSAVLSRDFLDSMFPGRAPSARGASRTRQPKPSVYERNREALDAFWEACLIYGRVPEPDEFSYEQIREDVGSAKRAYLALPFEDKEEQLAAAKARRTNDLLVYLGLNLFEQRRSFSALPASVQRDIRIFFGSLARALEAARAMLFATGSVDQLASSIEQAAAAMLGVRAPDGDYTFYRETLERQPPLVRLAVGCAERLEALPQDSELIKIHAGAGQVSYLSFDNFLAKPLPLLAQRTKVDLRHQRVWTESFDKIPERRVLFGKSKFLPRDFARFDTQARFDERLASAGIYATDGLGTSGRLVEERLADAGIKLMGFRVLIARGEAQRAIS
jgi:DNA phosphorothioation-associated putative methyltransferase